MKILHPIFVLAALLAITSVWSPPQIAHAAPAVATKPRPAPKPAATTPAPASASAAAAAPAADESNPMAAGRRLYDEAKFQQAYDLLGRALREGSVTGDDVIEARALRARCLVKLGRRLEAKEGFKSVLRLDRGFALDPNVVPPDEMQTFREAQADVDAERLEAGRRFPASIAAQVGRGNCVNQDLVDLASSAGVEPADNFSEDPEFSYAVRFPLKPRLSIDFEVSWLKAETTDKLPPERNAHTKFTATAMPVAVSLVRNLVTSPKRRVNVFVGGGPLIAQAILEDRNSLVAGRIIPTQIVGHNQGWYGHVGLEGEYMLHPRLAVTAQVRARRANSGTLHWLRDDYALYESWPASTLKDRSIDFSGVSASAGLRAYIGY